ncbi:MFS transporter [Alloacidobacterium dinghuense]|uniref:MFS transporter n=1 Tax=Alloacidobacterium dinghuense TaxID=2763107 RepID=A0A7G8BJZ2_9BACT|nr:MFS transporter [Alloacidobacterium dinghuense]QNI32862.1 MFS transporter [Alloacidobacterium dinghuense]
MSTISSTSASSSNHPLAWLQQASTMQRRVLLAASLGWMLDSMDVMLYALVVPSVKADLHLTSAGAGLIMSATLICAAIGGMLFGVFADRFGRTRALIASILVYCICTGLCGLVQTAVQLTVCRMLLGFGMGGEWAAGAALVAESWPDEHRAKALALMQSSWAIGYALGATIVALILPHFGWRAVFFAGLLPAAFAIWIRHKVSEPERWTNSLKTAGWMRSPAQIFRGRNGRLIAIATLVNAATLFAWWGLFFWVPSYLSLPIAQGGRGLSIVQTSTWTILMQVGTFLGYVSYGFLADRLGRKWVYIGYLFIAAIVVRLYAHATTPLELLWLGPMVGFWGTGYFSGFAVIASELFPTAIRATAMGFAYNTGRIVSAAAPLLVGKASDRNGMASALGITSISFLGAALLAILIPETRGKPLE